MIPLEIGSICAIKRNTFVHSSSSHFIMATFYHTESCHKKFKKKILSSY